MSIITLTSDMGVSDHYLATVKATILTNMPDARIVDISHDIRHLDVQHAAYVLGSSWSHFPMGSVHMIGVKSELTATTPHLIVHYMSHYFIGADNGIFSLLFKDQPEDIFEITYTQPEDWYFPMRGVFATCAAHLAKGGAPELLGRRVQEFKRIRVPVATRDDFSIKGNIIHFDNFGNIHTNIHRSMFDMYRASRPFAIQLPKSRHVITKIHNDFAEVTMGTALAFWGSNGHLIIGINQGTTQMGGSAQSLFGTKLLEAIIIKFNDHPNS
jgi:S-adenosylmethionine hydrolase